jgi:RecB family exonuclease
VNATPSWSFSSIKTFEQCPKKYYHLKVMKDYVEDQNAQHLVYGTEFHKAAEDYINGTALLPEKFKFAKSSLDNLKQRPGRKLCEYEMGLTANLEPCGFKDPNVWWRGIADLIILEDNGVARVLDYKTGASAKYADTGQLELMALAVFKHFPDVQSVKAGLLFVVAKSFPKANFHRQDEARLWEKWMHNYGRMKTAYDKNVWNPHPSGLCKKHCVVLSCPHNGRN